MKYLPVITLFSMMLLASAASSQSLIKQDSFHFDRGIAGTTDFSPRTRSIILEHDADGRPLVIITNRQNEAGQWQPWRRRQLTYQDGAVRFLLIQFWNNNSQNWVPIRQRNFNYNANRQLESRVFQRVPAPGMALEDDRQWRYEYDDNDRLINLLFQRWEGGQWVNTSRQLYTYNDQGLLQEQLFQVWDGSDWNQKRRRLLVYDANHQGLINAVGQEWSAETGSWVPTRRKNIGYNSTGLWSGVQMQTWDTLLGEWQNDSRQQFLHSVQNQFEGRIRQVWEAGEWKNQFRGGYTFDGQDLLARFERWDQDPGEWVTDRRYQLSYDQDGSLLLSQGWQNWNESSEAWVNDSTTVRYTYFWSALMTPTTEIATPYSCRVPNPYPTGTPFLCELPTSGKVFTLELFDLLGRKVYESSFSNMAQVAIDRPLPGGAYVLRIRQQDEVFHLQQLVIL